jgi:hypothetical protein
MNPGERGAVSSTLKLALPDSPLDRICGKARGANEQRQRGSGDYQRVAAAILPKLP